MAKEQVFYAEGQTKYSFDSLWSTRRVVSEIHSLGISTYGLRNQVNPFMVKHEVTSGSIINGQSGFKQFQNYPSALYDQSMAFASVESESTSGQRLLAATNPATAAVQLPVFLAELRDIPEMVHQAGHLALLIRDQGARAIKNLDTRALATANLAMQFGWKPFVEDIWKMLHFTDAVEKRRKWLSKLAKGPISRTLKDMDNRTQSDSYRLYSATDGGSNVSTIVNRTMSVRRWGSTRWAATYSGSIPQSDDDIRRLLSGLRADNIPINVWNALPWTWFTDYFVNISRTLKANNRSIATPSRTAVMTEYTTVLTHDSFVSSGLRFTGGTKRFVYRYRNASAPSGSFLAGSDNIEANSLSILASLAVVKNRKILGY